MMIKPITFFAFIVILFASCSTDNSTNNLTELTLGHWEGQFEIREFEAPFLFEINDKNQFVIDNNGEIVTTEEMLIEEDSITIYFTNFPNFFKFKKHTDKKIEGYFYSPDSGAKSKVLFTAHSNEENQPSEVAVESTSIAQIGGNWEVKFRPNTELEYPSVGKFQQEGAAITGTFLKNSGDARFLKGKINEKILILHGFDGSHVSYYRAELINDTLFGTYFPNPMTEIEWFGIRNDTFQLPNADSITILIKEEFALVFHTLEGEEFHYPNKELSGKPVLFQIMGTWCPNCLDEARFYKELYNQYHDKGLEIIGISYEVPEDFQGQAERILRYVNNENIPYPILVGGHLSKEKIAEDFDMLNRVSGFPTSIFINKSGKVVKIHTGFSGPGTGELYENYKQETIKFIEELLD